MQVEIGPVASSSALMWLAYARTVLTRVLLAPEKFGLRIADADFAQFEHFLNVWEDAATTSTTFHWVGQEQPEVLRRLAETWLAIADVLAKEELERGYPLAHPDSFAFNDALALGVLNALAELPDDR